MLRIAVPNKGRLSEDAVRLLREAGYQCQAAPNELKCRDERNDIDFFFLRPKDIPAYVHNGVLDLGITGRDLVLEHGAVYYEVLTLEFGQSRFHYAVSAASSLEVKDFNGLRIATSYPNLVANHLQKLGIKARIVTLDGAVEISVQLGVADAIADVVQSGKTIKAAGLRIIGEPVAFSEAILIAKESTIVDQPGVVTFMERLRGIITARNYRMIEYDIARDRLAEACGITPGIESPTISPLNKEGWLAVKAMVQADEVNQIMDQLKQLGAKGIIATQMSSCRL